MKVGRNDPCPCGSEKKYKKCCLRSKAEPADYMYHKLSQVYDKLVDRLMRYAATVFGPDALLEALDEFLGWSDEVEEDALMVHGQLFYPWFIFDWHADPVESKLPPAAPREISIARSYMLQKRLEPLQQELIEKISGAPHSFFEVLQCNAGQGFLLQDILLEQKVQVTERSGSRSSKTGDIIFGRVVRFGDLGMIFGNGMTIMPPIEKTAIINFRKYLREMNGGITEDTLFEFGEELRDLYLSIHKSLHSDPALCNTDGDPLSFHTLHYDIKLPGAVFAALKDLALDMEDDDLLRDAEFSPDRNLTAVEIPWMQAGNKKHKGWENTVLGRIFIQGKSMKIEVNSRERAEKISRIIEERLSGQALYKMTSMEAPEAMLRGDPDPGTMKEHEELMQLPEVQVQLAEIMRAHWQGWVDIPLPALGGKTPMEAVRDPDGKEQVEALLRQFERDSESQGQSGIARADLALLRERLGLAGSGK